MRWLTDYPRKAGATRRSYRYALQAFSEEFARLRLADLDRVTARGWALRHRSRTYGWFGRCSTMRSTTAASWAESVREPPPGAVARPEGSDCADGGRAGRARRDGAAGARRLRACVPGDDPLLGIRGAAAGGAVRAGAVDVSRDEVHSSESRWHGALKAPKNDQERVVVLPPPAREALKDVPARLDVPWLFVTPRGRRFAKSSLYYYWIRCERRWPAGDGLLRAAPLLRDAPARAGRVAR